MTVALLTGPSHEPVSLAEAKMHIRVDHVHDNLLITDLISAARIYVENASGHKLISQAWRQYESCLPADREILSQVHPVQSVAAVTAFDHDGVPHTLAGTDYVLHKTTEPLTVEILPVVSQNLAENGLEIDWVAGVADIAAELPTTLKRAILMLVAHWYEFRGAVEVSQHPVSLPLGFDALISPYRRVKL